MLSVLVLRRVSVHDRNTVHNMNVCEWDDFSQIQDEDNRENPSEICLQSCFQWSNLFGSAKIQKTGEMAIPIFGYFFRKREKAWRRSFPKPFLLIIHLFISLPPFHLPCSRKSAGRTSPRNSLAADRIYPDIQHKGSREPAHDYPEPDNRHSCIPDHHEYPDNWHCCLLKKQPSA